MAVHGITDIGEIVALPKSEYEELIRESEQLKVIKRLLEGEYTSTIQLKNVYGGE